MTKSWPIVILIAVLGALYYVATGPSEIGNEIRSLFYPILEEIERIIETIFGSG